MVYSVKTEHKWKPFLQRGKKVKICLLSSGIGYIVVCVAESFSLNDLTHFITWTKPIHDFLFTVFIQSFRKKEYSGQGFFFLIFSTFCLKNELVF